MSKPDDIPQDVWATAQAAHATVASISLAEPDRDIIVLARAILTERHRCALIVRNHAAGRTSQSASARSKGQKKEAYDFQTMALSADQIAFDILAGRPVQVPVLGKINI
jgi:hypothetical protein